MSVSTNSHFIELVCEGGIGEPRYAAISWREIHDRSRAIVIVIVIYGECFPVAAFDVLVNCENYINTKVPRNLFGRKEWAKWTLAEVWKAKGDKWKCKFVPVPGPPAWLGSLFVAPPKAVSEPEKGIDSFAWSEIRPPAPPPPRLAVPWFVPAPPFTLSSPNNINK